MILLFLEFFKLTIKSESFIENCRNRIFENFNSVLTMKVSVIEFSTFGSKMIRLK